MYKLKFIDYYQIFISIMMVILGGIILFRCFQIGVNFLSLLVGAGFLFLGIYRIKFIINFFKKRKI